MQRNVKTSKKKRKIRKPQRQGLIDQLRTTPLSLFCGPPDQSTWMFTYSLIQEWSGGCSGILYDVITQTVYWACHSRKWKRLNLHLLSGAVGIKTSGSTVVGIDSAGVHLPDLNDRVRYAIAVDILQVQLQAQLGRGVEVWPPVTHGCLVDRRELVERAGDIPNGRLDRSISRRTNLRCGIDMPSYIVRAAVPDKILWLFWRRKQRKALLIISFVWED